VNKRSSCILLGLCLALPLSGVAQSNSAAARHKAEKNSQQYQKHFAKMHKQQARQQAKSLKAFRKQHHIH
jgi:hypothetical protein